MPTYWYRARRNDGTEVEGTFIGKDRFALYDELRAQGLILEACGERRGLRAWLQLLWEWLDSHVSTVREVEKIRFAKDIAAMLRAGLPLTRALAVVERQARNHAFRRLVGEARQGVERGHAFHEALRPFTAALSPLFVAMVRAGEASGRLPEALATVGEQLERVYQLKKKIRGAMLYPAIVLSALIAVGVLMLVYIVPSLESTFQELNVPLPTSTRVVLAVSEFLRTHGVISGILAVSVGIAVYLVARHPRGRAALSWVARQIPVVGTLVVEANTARTTRTLASLLASGVPVADAFDITAEVVQSPAYRAFLQKAREGVLRGEPLATHFMAREDLFPPFVGELVAVGEEAGALPDMLQQVALFYEADVEEKTKDMSTIIEPFLMVVVGVAVGFFAIAMITPIYSVTQAI